MTPRQSIEEFKIEFRSLLEQDVLQLKKAVIRELDALWRSYKMQHPEADYDLFADEFLKLFKLPRNQVNEIKRELKKTQTKIAELHEQFFNTVTPGVIELKPGQYERIIAAYQVDFPGIEETTRSSIVDEIKKASIAGYGFETIRTNLVTKGFGTGEAYTLANTAVSQFDNATMFEFAAQAGLNEFKYGGVLQKDSRIFCVELITADAVYTVQQIMAMDNKQGLPVKTSCGGYNCTHYWYVFVKKLKK
ncbi:MAG: hypothetical protein IPM56_16170 [Ignavibacteriales bacterium]|nr:MAG: hypothetical protein IPM56_16170 [Ignavibacteriales bacterium]